MSYLNEWFDFCNYLKLTTNLTVLRSILLSSLTIGVPQYSIEIRETTLTMKRISQHELEININKSEYLNSSDNNNKEGEHYNHHPSQNSMISKLSKNLLDVNEKYQPLIDDLLDLSDIIDLSQDKFGDSINLILINRAIILVDLVKHLDDKFFQDNYSYILCKLIDSIITEVFYLKCLKYFIKLN